MCADVFGNIRIMVHSTLRSILLIVNSGIPDWLLVLFGNAARYPSKDKMCTNKEMTRVSWDMSSTGSKSCKK